MLPNVLTVRSQINARLLTDVDCPADKRYCGVNQPKFRGNMSSLFRWKDLSVNLSFAFHWGGKQYNETLRSKVEVTEDIINRYNVDQRVFKNRWQKPGDIKPFKGYDSSMTRTTSRYVMNDNVFQFQSANIQYRWHSDYLRKVWRVEAINIGANLSDIFYISSIKRERGTFYPFSRQVSFSFSLMF